MSYQLTKSQKEIQKAAREFAKGEFDKDLAYEMDKNQEFPQKIWKKAAELGFIGMHFPEKYSGGELDVLDNVLLAEEFCRKDSTIGSALMLSAFASECLLRFGSNELKEKYLPKVAEGKMLSGAAYSEPDTDAAFDFLNTMAVKDNDEWIVNGEKSYVLNAGMAGFYCVLCHANDDQRTHLILVESQQEGLSIVDKGEKLRESEHLLAYKNRRGLRLGAESYFFQEGDADLYANAEYGELRVDSTGAKSND